MLDNFRGSLRLLGSIVVLGFQLVIPQPSIEHRKVPQRIEEQSVAPEEDNAGIPGVWGSWGPWSACSRSCDGGVMEQTRPCLPGHYYERSYRRPGPYWGSERTLTHQPQLRQEDPLNAYAGHVISAIRTSVPLHRKEDPSRAALRAAFSLGGRNDSYPSNKGTSRGGRLSPSLRRSPKSERRSKNKSPIGPGKYGYGKVPYILPLQTDTGQSPHKPRRHRQSARRAAHQQASGPEGPFPPLANPPQHPGSLFQDPQRLSARSPAASSNIYSQRNPHLQAFSASQSLFHGTDLSTRVPVSRPSQASARRAAVIVCTGAYKQHKLCNTNACLENRSIREVQCASYNIKPFMGRFYEWEPFAEELHLKKRLLSLWKMEQYDNGAHVGESFI
nr:thrombospondin type-1 domain-containing protein 4-like [Pogona vitticeps]